MRYSFHGKMRFTGQSVDGFIDADHSSEAIDRLAEEGVIGVYTVNPAPHYAKSQLFIAGAPLPVVPLPAPVQPATTAMDEKLTTLIALVEKMLARPMGSAPTRNEGSSKRKAISAAPEEQNAALRAIFQSNIELRRSVEKLAQAAALRPLDKSHHVAVQPPRTIKVPAQPAA